MLLKETIRVQNLLSPPLPQRGTYTARVRGAWRATRLSPHALAYSISLVHVRRPNDTFLTGPHCSRPQNVTSHGHFSATIWRQEVVSSSCKSRTVRAHGNGRRIADQYPYGARERDCIALKDRRTFTPAADVLPFLKGKSRGKLSPYVNDAIRAFEWPPLQVRLPAEREPAFLDDLLPQANHEINLLGVSLHRILPAYGDLLKNKVENGVELTAVILNHELPESSPVYKMLAMLLRGDGYVKIVRQRAADSLVTLRALKRHGMEHGTTVRILRYADLPPYGLVIRDPHGVRSRMRVNIFNVPGVDRLHPYFDIEPKSAQAKIAYDVFFEYYQALISRGTVDDGVVQQR